MSSDLQSTLQDLQFNDYTSAVAVTVLIYDYFLVFSREVNYVWDRPWTWVSTMFVVVRYFGLSSAILENLWGATFGPDTVEVWMGAIFLAAADWVMILRVYAMWNRSKRILFVLLFIYVSQVIVSFVFTGVYQNPSTYLSVKTARVLNFTFCAATFRNLPLILATHLYDGILRFILSIAIFVLAVIQTLKQSVDMFKATKQWQPNRYMQQLATDGILYFLVYVFFNIYAIVQNSSTNIDIRVILSVVSYVVIITITPRFIISVRELYDRDVRGRWDGLDTGFGVLSQPAGGVNTVVSAIAFADANPGQGDGQVGESDAGDSEVIRLEAMRDETRQVMDVDLDTPGLVRLENRAGQV